MKGRQIGIFGIAVIAVSILGYCYISKKEIFDNSTKIYAFIEDPTGVSTKSPILINGYEIGKVSNLEIIDTKVLIELSVDKELGINKEAQLFSTPSSFIGGRQIDLENFDKNGNKYQNGDTIKSKIITKILQETLDPELKKLSRTIGAALMEYGESKTKKCDSNQLEFVLNRIENHPNDLSEKDAYILIENQCLNEVELSQLQNELTFKLIEIKPNLLIEILSNTNFNKEVISDFYSRIENPIHDGFDLEDIIQRIKELEQNSVTEKLIKSIQIAIDKY